MSLVSERKFNLPIGLRQTFSALKHYNYRLWFIGQLVSLVGTWMQNTAQGFLVYQMTGSPAYLGYVGFASGLPSWLFMLYGGVVADRVARRTLLVITQSVMMALAFILAWLVFAGTVQPWHIVVLALLLGIATSFDAPSRQSFVVELVESEDIPNAIALNSSMFNGAAVIGPAVAGLAYAVLGPAWCFTINGISFIAVIIALLMMKMKPVDRQPRTSTALDDIREGLRYVGGSPTIVQLLVSLAMVAVGMSLVTLLPAWAVSVLGGDVKTNGWLISARGTGALIGALLVAWTARFQIRGKLWAWGLLGTPFLIFGFAFSRALPLSMLMLTGVGVCFMITVNTMNSIIQTQVPDALRGRVMSIYTLVFFGTTPLGALFAGSLASTVKEETTVLLLAGAMLLYAAYAWLKQGRIRDIS